MKQESITEFVADLLAVGILLVVPIGILVLAFDINQEQNNAEKSCQRLCKEKELENGYLDYNPLGQDNCMCKDGNKLKAIPVKISVLLTGEDEGNVQEIVK